MASEAEIAAQAAALANQKFQLWISGIGIVSTLIGAVIVSAINSWTTLRGKETDAKLKKDEQSYGYNMEYLKRKLSAGEKEITKQNLFLNTLSWDYFYYSHTLQKQYMSTERIQSLHERNNEIIKNSQQAAYSDDDSYFAYFEHESDFHNPNHILRRYERTLHELISMNAELYRDDTPLRKALEEKVDTATIANPLIAFKALYDKTQEKTREFLALNKEAQTHTLNFIAGIRQQMKETPK